MEPKGPGIIGSSFKWQLWGPFIWLSSVCTDRNTLQGLLWADVLNINTENWFNRETNEHLKTEKRENEQELREKCDNLQES